LRRELDVLRESKRIALARLADRLHAAGPESVLRRGFVILRDAERKPLTSRAAVQPGQKVTAQWHDGEAPLQAE
jgi:exonuclease VII large subunit